MKPDHKEDLHIWELEQKRRIKVLEAEQQTLAEKEKNQLKERHWMHCPKCGQKLMIEKHGSVEIDICPSCRGLWLDANELEAIIAKESNLLHSCLRILKRS